MKKNKPNLIVVGAQKAGTTSFFDKLSSYREFYLPKKEIKYFHRDEFYNLGEDWYLEHFANYSGQRYIGDFTPDYMAYSWTAERMFKMLGKEVKLIFVLRDPIQRSFSQFNFHKMYEVENRDNFIEVIEKEEIDLKQSSFNSWHDPENYISRSLYFLQVERFLKYFEKSQIHIIIFEELFIKKEAKALKDLEKFLEMDLPGFFDQNQHSNPSQIPTKNLASKSLSFLRNKAKFLIQLLKWIFPNKAFQKIKGIILDRSYDKPLKIEKEEKKRLTEKYFREDISKLENFIGRKIEDWS